MLVLSRKINDSILIGTDITITVLGVEGERVKIGIDAPKNVRILRMETIDKSIDENKLAAESSLNLSEIFRMMENK